MYIKLHYKDDRTVGGFGPLGEGMATISKVSAALLAIVLAGIVVCGYVDLFVYLAETFDPGVLLVALRACMSASCIGLVVMIVLTVRWLVVKPS